eukprot:TRINITY_DN18345_c0_g1_i1.p1 TRINITY_DN18345_c0_g1~~TRINITY_DN18345_c0_g1_i1.p1  ORF type:complete len:441 (+),score=71.15 TRINITY_DN18345_c0_g1_i1:62-1384(+)
MYSSLDEEAARLFPEVHRILGITTQRSQSSPVRMSVDKIAERAKAVMKSRVTFRCQRLRSGTDWEVPANYDFNEATNENYSQHGKDVYGPFAAIRARLDFSYHGNYTRERQAYQDGLIQDVVGAGIAKLAPWIIFTAGAMGTGKSFTIHWMSDAGYFPLSDLVQIDPDAFKTAFPEWQGYIDRDPRTAGYHTRKESGYLVEIAQEAAMEAAKNVWVDGSLRDADWYVKVFKDIRERFKGQYRIAILSVTAPKEVVLERARARELVTGRHVPETEILDSLARVPQSVERLAPLAAFIANITNVGSTPQLSGFCNESVCFRNACDSWEEVAKRFATLPEFADAEKWNAFIEEVIGTAEVVAFNKSYCSYSKRLLRLLRSTQLQFREVVLDQMPGGEGPALQLALARRTGQKTVPVVFLRGKFVGGFTETKALHDRGALLAAL